MIVTIPFVEKNPFVEKTRSSKSSHLMAVDTRFDAICYTSFAKKKITL